ncbi:MAG: hypothetical protein IPF66_06345 [Holophagales bacterium]|nr:hypothetical protein [Holophagales bacterium]
MKPSHSLLLLALLACSSAGAQTPDGRGFDPTGVWYGQHGPLALMRAGDTLTFSYSGVFGATAHICDGIGVAGFAGDGTWEYADEQGTVTFTTKGGKVTMQTTNGIASFCGANWLGDTFTKDGWKPAFNCTVVAPKAHLLTAAPSPEQRKGYVVKGNVVEAVGLVNEGTPGWLLVRYVGKKQTTAGLLGRDALECREE